ncbi:hypothetical protein FA10DRAFT_269607 [Acaromyces ingoldii]|uniref:Cyanovirin-N domain-containing protein n=1 Tax=Acaromyces ingoldii TaxID=215250 RepID=A0A316YCK8_9BASI|nr:hypothetical protein FA10DRAFT_269607 [Acaromyces ingoldii]PWN86992.1 hypothetical protein FA10DRAFT_269607 [Acaromyces ingoldii]
MFAASLSLRPTILIAFTVGFVLLSLPVDAKTRHTDLNGHNIRIARCQTGGDVIYQDTTGHLKGFETFTCSDVGGQKCTCDHRLTAAQCVVNFVIECKGINGDMNMEKLTYQQLNSLPEYENDPTKNPNINIPSIPTITVKNPKQDPNPLQNYPQWPQQPQWQQNYNPTYGYNNNGFNNYNNGFNNYNNGFNNYNPYPYQTYPFNNNPYNNEHFGNQFQKRDGQYGPSFDQYLSSRSSHAPLERRRRSSNDGPKRLDGNESADSAAAETRSVDDEAAKEPNKEDSTP